MEDSATAPVSRAEIGRLMQRATYAAVATAALLIAAKLFAWLETGSVVMLGALLDSVLDAAASLVNLFAVRHALTPADREHRFGHGKAESIAGLGQAAFIAGSATFLLFESGRNLVSPQPIEHGWIGIAVMVFAILLTGALVWYQHRVVRRTGSIAIGADSVHYRGDLLMNLSIIAALLLSSRLGWTWADPLFALGVALYLLHNAWEILRSAFDHLMDRELPDAERARIRAIVMRHPQSLAMHDLRTRSSGTHSFIQFHLELDPHMELIEAHRIGDEIEASIIAAFPGAQVIIHQDPAGLEQPAAGYART